jgi:hypothetical protein
MAAKGALPDYGRAGLEEQRAGIRFTPIPVYNLDRSIIS